MHIFLARNNVQAGPYTLEQLNQMLATGQVLLTDLMWHQGMDNWNTVNAMTDGQFFTVQRLMKACQSIPINVSSPLLMKQIILLTTRLILYRLQTTLRMYGIAIQRITRTNLLTLPRSH